jgi:hypothetical protein
MKSWFIPSGMVDANRNSVILFPDDFLYLSFDQFREWIPGELYY